MTEMRFKTARGVLTDTARLASRYRWRLSNFRPEHTSNLGSFLSSHERQFHIYKKRSVVFRLCRARKTDEYVLIAET